MEVDTVKHVWYNTLVGNSLEWSWTEGGEQKTVFVSAFLSFLVVVLG